MWLVVACLLPGILGTAYMFVHEYSNRLDRVEADKIATARAMVLSVDSQLIRAKAVAQTAATYEGLRHRDLAGFHRWAREVIAKATVGPIIVLSDESGRQLVNTLREYGQPLPRHGNPEVLQRVFATGQPVISEVYIGGVLRKPVMSIDVPVIIHGKVVYDLSVALLPSDFNGILATQKFDPSWITTIFDNRGTIVARTLAPEKLIGQKGVPELLKRISESPEGSMESITTEGIPVMSFWSRSLATGWSVRIGIPQETFKRELMDVTIKLASGMAALLAAGLGLAWFAGRKITRSVYALMIPAAEMGKGLPVTIPDVEIEESAEVAEAIAQAAELLKAQADELEQVRQSHVQQLERQVEERTVALSMANAKLEQLVRTDTLTGLQNRLSANERLRLEFLRMKRSGSSYAVLFMDIDHFKKINDTYGHETGDVVLQQLAGTLEASLRETDFVARFGGEEFLVILSDTNQEGALTIAEKIRSAVSEQSFPVVQHVTVSIGITMSQGEDKNEDEAVHRADKALYQAKESGRNTVRFC